MLNINVMDALEEEIALTKKEEKSIYIKLIKQNEDYFGIPDDDVKLEGECIFSAKNENTQTVNVVTNKNGTITVKGIESDSQTISAFLKKDSSSLLTLVKDKIKSEDLNQERGFIIGPPGTGKTKVITKAIKEAIKQNKRVLVLSPTNTAVENVFERLDENLGLKDGEIVLTINTENEYLKTFTPDNIYERQIEPLEDEQEILEDSLKEIYLTKRDLETSLYAQEKNLDASEILIKNNRKTLLKKNNLLSSVKKEYEKLTDRVSRLENNVLLRSVANILNNKKLSQLKMDSNNAKNEIELLNEEILLIDKKISSEDELLNIKSKELKNIKKDYKKLITNKDKIENRLDQIKEKISSLQGNSFQNAKLVGATLAKAALSEKIQSGSFDIIIIDEASMALYPLVISAAQSLNDKKIEKTSHSYKDDESLYPAQNEAVRLCLNSKLIFVGDPKQLTGIAKNKDMKKTVFEIFGINNIFKGEKINNAIMLDINFRNHPDIVKMTSKLFYGGLLKSGKKHNGKKSIITRDVKFRMLYENGSYINKGNLEVVLKDIKNALEKGRRSIGVITPFKGQAKEYNKRFMELHKLYPDAILQAGTIHTFQGKENDVIFYDITFSTDGNNSIPIAYDGDINSETAKLINVATTRAEDFFIVVGDIEGIAKLPKNNLVIKDWINAIKNINI